MNIGKGGLIGHNHAGTCACFNRHIAQSHAPFHGEAANDGPTELDDVARPDFCPQMANDEEGQVFGGDARSKLALHANVHRFGSFLEQALCCQHLFDFACPDAKGQRAKRSMGRGMRVSTHNRHPRQGKAQFRPDDMHNALTCILHIKKCEAEVTRILLHRGNALNVLRVYHIEHAAAIYRGDIMIENGNGSIRSAHFETRGA